MIKTARTKKPIDAKPARPDVEVQEERPNASDAVKATRLRAGEVSVVDSHAPALQVEEAVAVEGHAPVHSKR